MAISTFKPLDHITAEFIKLKRTPIPLFMLFCCCFVGFITFASHAMDVHNTARVGVDPWIRYFKGSMSIYSIFVLTPFIILLVSAKAFIEQRANAYKYLYSNPIKRGHIYFYKLFMILFLLLVMVLLSTIILVGLSFILEMRYPEFEFSYHSIGIANFFKMNMHSLIASLGIVGIQFFLCMNSKNFMIPLGIGIFGFVLGFILMVTASKYSAYLPYEYPMIVKDFGMVNFPHRSESFISGINNLQLNSIICFVFFVILGYIFEIKKNIK